MANGGDIIVNGGVSQTEGLGYDFYGSYSGVQYVAGGPALAVSAAVKEIYSRTHVVNNSKTANSDPAMSKAINTLSGIITDTYVSNAISQSQGNSSNITDPNGGHTNSVEFNNIVDHMTFNIVDTTYGPGRAGENIIDPATGNITVNISAHDFLVYASEPGGLNYLVDHEVAHDSSGGVAESAAMWNSFLHLPQNASLVGQLNNPSTYNAAMSHLAANYALSTQFATNEAFANSLGFSYYNYSNQSGNGDGGFLAHPTNGFYHH